MVDSATNITISTKNRKCKDLLLIIYGFKEMTTRPGLRAQAFKADISFKINGLTFFSADLRGLKKERSK